jgi:hypothetical protein
MSSVTEKLDAEKAARERAARKKKVPSGKGDGKWQTHASLADYRMSRDKAKKLAKKNRKRNKR